MWPLQNMEIYLMKED